MVKSQKSKKKPSLAKKKRIHADKVLNLPVLPVKKYKVIKLAEVQAHEQKYIQLLMETNICLNYIYEGTVNIQEEAAKQFSKEKWNAYVNCDPYPQPDTPSDVRGYNAKLKSFENRNIKETFNWLICVDERNILRERCAEDLTRRTLSRTKIQLGHQYDKMVGDYLEILRRLDNYLRNNKATTEVKTEVLMDITELRKTLHKEMYESINSLTYRILSSGDAYMESLDFITEEYCFSGDNFLIHIWSLKNVPIRFTHLPEPRMVANLHNSKILLHIPYSMLRPNLTVQAVHLNIDTFSEHSKSFKLEAHLRSKNFIAGIQVLPESLMREYEMQRRLQKRVRSEIVANYGKHQEVIENALQRLRKLNKEKKAKPLKQLLQRTGRERMEQKLKKLIKSQKPQFLSDDEYPQIFEEFLKEEERQYESFLEIAHDPATLNLSYDEINLRKFIILDGVHQLNFVQKPLNINFGNIDMIWHSDDRRLVIEKENRICEPFSVNSKSVASNISCLNCEKLISPVDILKQSIDPLHPLFVLVFHVPDYLCYWGEPIACYHEETQEVVKITELDAKACEKESAELINIRRATSILQSKLEGTKLQKLDAALVKAHHLSSRYFQNYVQSEHSAVSMLRSKCFPRPMADLEIRDFPLDPPFTNEQLDAIKAFCLPEMLSSYKFLKEVKSEQKKVKTEKAEERHLFRRSIREEQLPEFNFNEYQNNAERIFAVFDKAKSPHIIEGLETFQSRLSSQPRTFYKLVKTLILIKRIIQFGSSRILQLKPFESKMNLQKFRHKMKKKMLKSIEREAEKRHMLLPEPSKQIFGLNSKITQRRSPNNERRASRPLPGKINARTSAKRESKGILFPQPSKQILGEYAEKSKFSQGKSLSKERRETRLSSKNDDKLLMANINSGRESGPSSKELKMTRKTSGDDRKSNKAKPISSPKKFNTTEKTAIPSTMKRKSRLSSKEINKPLKVKSDNRLSVKRASKLSSKTINTPAQVNKATAVELVRRKSLTSSKKLDIPTNMASVKRKSKFFSKNYGMRRKENVENRTPLKPESRLSLKDFDMLTRTNGSSITTSVKQEFKLPTILSSRTGEVKNRIIGNSLSVKILGELKDAEVTTHSHWTTKHIKYSHFIKNEQLFVIETDRLGVFGFAYKRYEHFPFKYWTMQPSKVNPENEVTFTIDTQHVRCVLNINEKGIHGYVSEPVQTGKFVKTPKMYLVITDPIRDIAVLKKRFEEKNLNIFANNDASFYIENGYHSVKHVATENHTYYCMALHSTQIKFTFSQWNRLAERRDIILQFDNYKKPSENSFEVRVTPEGVTFVDVAEECSFTSETTILRYKRTWRNFELYSDLHRAVCSVFSDAINLRCRNSNVIDSLIYLLHAIRPLSFS